MSASISLQTVLNRWAAGLRQRHELPVLLRSKGLELKLGNFDHPPELVVDVQSPQGMSALLQPSLDSLGQAYVEGHLDIHGSAQAIMHTAWRLAKLGHEADQPGWMARVARRVSEAVAHTPTLDQQAIAYHYDVSNDFYARWLDPEMVYSCAYFENGDETLAQAQLKKLDHILRKLRLQPGQRLLDIGCGWGALVLRAAQKFQARCTGITLSQNQYELARERVRAAGLQDQVEIRLQDYRDLEGQFDRISSVGMFEHVGLKNLVDYFRIVAEHLTPDGWALNHGITSTDADNGETAFGGGRFIHRYVFPHGELPHISTVLDAAQRAGLEPVDVESLRRHYARTLHCWSDRFEAQDEALKALVPEKTWRIWRVYLVGCQWAFERDQISVFQLLCQRAGQDSHSLPWSRRWMYDTTAAL